MHSALEIRSGALKAILDHALQQVPIECCGLLVGADRRIERAVPARNLLASPTRYQVDPSDHFAAIRGTRSDGLVVVGAYHSHPLGPPVPSATDLAEATYADYAYLIVSPKEDDPFGAYYLDGQRFERIALKPI